MCSCKSPIAIRFPDINHIWLFTRLNPRLQPLYTLSNAIVLQAAVCPPHSFCLAYFITHSQHTHLSSCSRVTSLEGIQLVVP